MEKISIVVFGDSILKGVVTIPESKNLFDVTENDSLSLAQKELGFELDNRSIYGNITSKGLVKLQKYLEKGGHADLCVIEFGSNDCDYDWNIFTPGAQLPAFDSIPPKVPMNDYLTNLEAMVNLCRKHKITPVIMNLIPYICDKWFKTIAKGHDQAAILQFLGGSADTLGKNQEKYYKALMDFVSKKGLQLIDVWKLFSGLEKPEDFMCDDGIHPNEEGYKLLANLWIEDLPKIKKEF
ncbi:MAG: SGNH/GDSL hydrolase family protein [Treponema sp.]|nr:SGNH/GDSL hydrolase family protein [Treponema sp.]